MVLLFYLCVQRIERGDEEREKREKRRANRKCHLS